jgi:hypothetical protein
MRPPFFLSPWFKALAGTALALAGLGSPEARAQSGYREIAYFEEGRVATLGIVVEYQPGGSRNINLNFRRTPYGGPMFFHEKEWKLFSDNLSRVKGGPDGREQTFVDIDTLSSGLLRMSAVRHGDAISLTLIRQPDKGDSYPAVPFHLAPADFENLLQATVAAAKAEIIVSAASAEEFARFRADLGTRFTPEQLQEFDTAIQELKLAAMNRGITTEASMLAVANRNIFSDVVVLGWRARKDRIIREIPGAIRLVNQDMAEATKTAATGTPEDFTRRLATEKETLAKLRHDRDDALRRLDALAQVIGRPE